MKILFKLAITRRAIFLAQNAPKIVCLRKGGGYGRKKRGGKGRPSDLPPHIISGYATGGFNFK